MDTLRQPDATGTDTMNGSEQFSARLKDFAEMQRLLPEDDEKPWELFRVLGKSTDELAHSKLLAYLLDPARPHGLGTTFLQAFLQISGIAEALDMSDVRVATEVVCGRRRADIVVEGPDWFLLIENKVFSGEGDGQTVELEELFVRHRQYAGKTPVFVYLTPKGIPADNGNFQRVSYGRVAGTIEAMPHGVVLRLPAATQFLLAQFVEHIEENICMTKTEWAKISEQSRLYIMYASEIERVTGAIRDDLTRVWAGWQDAAERILGPGWEFRNYKGDVRQAHRKDWRKDGFFIHFEVFLGRRQLSKRRISFMLEVEKQGGGEEAPEDIIKLFDDAPDFKASVEAIGSDYRPEHRSKAVAYREYELMEDLSNLGDVLVDSLEQHSCLADLVDAILDGRARREEPQVE